MVAKKMLFMVDDQPEQLRLLEMYAHRLGHRCEGFTSAKACLERLGTQTPDAIITDLFMPEVDGITFVQNCHQKYPQVPILVLTVSDSTTDAVRAIRYGAWDFITKPLGFERFQVTVDNMLGRHELQKEINSILRQAQGQVEFDDIVGFSEPMENLFEGMRNVAHTQTPVLITGESGVGKELVAKALHAASERHSGPLIAVNCGAIPETLVESTLFGHEKGAFTGANNSKEGKFQAANGGTLFLDEIGDLPLKAQVKLLRAIQEGEIEPVGSTKAVPVHVRLICATNKNLGQMVRKGQFREDLFYRINVYPLEVPPLRARGDDVIVLTEAFIAKIAAKNGQQKKNLSRGAISFLQSYPWPGNVRQLENAVMRAMISNGQKSELQTEDFTWLTPANTPREMPMDVHVDGDHFVAENNLFELPQGIVPLAELESRYIRHVVDLCGGNLTKAAKKLQVARGTLYRKLG